MIQRSREHLESVDESYFEHLGFASSVGLLLIVSGLACILHGLVPAWFMDRGSRTVRKLYARFEARGAGGPVVGRDFAGLILFFILCVAAALLPWLVGVGRFVATTFSFLALSLLGAGLWSSGGGPDENEAVAETAPVRISRR